MAGCGDKCSCENLTTYEPCGENLTCCEFCPGGAPCAYAIISKCRWRKNGLFLNGITPLWKECLFECKWTARRCISVHTECIDGGGFGSSGAELAAALLGCGEGGESWLGLQYPSLGDLFPPVGDADTDHGDHIIQISPPVALDDDGTTNVATRLKLECARLFGNPQPQPYRCGWHDWFGRDSFCDTDVEAWLNTCTAIAWELEVTATDTATLTAYQTTDGTANVEVVATYNCDDWQCIPEFAAEDKESHGNTFIMDGDPAVGFEAHLSRKLCVVPYSSDWHTHCGTPGAACDCCDNGAETGCLDVDFGDCGGAHTVTITRNYTLPSGVTDPGGACGYFWGTVTTDCSFTFGILTYCDGTDWHVDLWCSLDGWHEIDTATATLTQCCPGATYTWTWSGDWGDCCCPPDEPVTTDCCPDDPVPTTLTVTFGSDGDACTCLAGIEMPLAWNGSGWTGTQAMVPSADPLCADCDITITILLYCDAGTWKVDWSGGVCGGSATVTAVSASCDPFELVFGSPSITVASCPCAVSGGAGTCVFPFTITV